MDTTREPDGTERDRTGPDGPDRWFDAPGTRLPAHFEVDQLLERTDHARIFGGFDRRSGIAVVLKEYHRSFARNARREARALARLGEHPNILSVLAAGRGPGMRYWMVTEHAAGGSLAQRRGAPPRQVVLWGAQLAEALAHTHAHGVVHGDVTPANVLLGSDLCVRLGDFGSAVLLGDAPADGRPTGHTPAFAAPERRRLEPATPADDVYSLAATILEVSGDPRVLPRRTRRILQRCLGVRASRPDVASLVRDLTP